MEKYFSESSPSLIGRTPCRKLSENFIRETKIELKTGKKKDTGSHKWKDKFQGTIDRMEHELRRYEDRIQMTENINYLYQQFKGSNIKPILNILHEKYYGIQENFVFERKSKVNKNYIRKPG